jgi:tetratricopeptide (TPR) repeat protein
MVVVRFFRTLLRASWLAAVVVACGGTGALAQQAPPAAVPTDPAALAYQISKTARTEKQYSQIIELCHKALAGQPAEKQAAYSRKLEAWAYNRRGELRADAGEDDKAQADFEAAVKIDKTNWRALHNRGVGYAAHTKFAEAAADFDEVIRLHADFEPVWFNRGELRSQNADFNGAIDDYNQALKLQPNDPSALIGRGHAWYQLGENEEALKDYDRALELDGQRAVTFVFRAAALAEAGRYAAAADDYRAAIRLEPNSAAGYQAAAWLMATCPDEQFRDAKLAVKAARRAIELRGHDEYRDQETMAAALAEDGQFDAAVKAQQRAIELAGPVDKELAKILSDRLKVYRTKKPYREIRDTQQADRSSRRQR